MAERTDLPTGVVTFMFTDIEGSTMLVQRLGERAAELFAVHAALVRSAVASRGGIEVNTEGDSFFCVFVDAADAVAAAVDIQRALHGHPWPADRGLRVRIGIHTGVGTRGGDDYFGLDVHRAARISTAGHGGQILLSDATTSLMGGSSPEGATIRDLGMFRLKDLAGPEHLHDVVIEGLPSEFPPLAAAGAPRVGMPARLTLFVGRTAEVEDVSDLVSRSRLVTLTGPGGVGKTRLSVEVADRLLPDFEAGFFVELAPVRDPELVAPTILSAVGAAPSHTPAAARLPELLAGKRWLLVLDNFEHVVEAAPVVGSIVREAQDLRVLVSSRAPLRVAGEREYEVRPLAHHGGGPDELPDAALLFVDRALAVQPDLALDRETVAAIMEICEALDGLPLAIELAASRVRVMSPVALQHRLGSVLDVVGAGSRDLDERQRTLRNTIGWSYDLLAEEDRRLLRDMAVFRGGASLDTIEAVCGIDREHWLWLDGLERLVEHSLVQRVETGNDTRFVLLEMIREFAAEKLDGSGDRPRVAQRHLDWFLAFAEQAAEGLTTVDQGMWLSGLDRERDNLREALAWAFDRGDAERASRLVLALWRHWQMRGPLAEGVDRVAKVLAMETLDDRGRLRAMEAAGGLEWWSGHMDESAARYSEALELARRVGTEAEIAHALYNAGLAIGFASRAERGNDLLEECLMMGERLGSDHLVALSRWGMSAVLQTVGELGRAHGLLLTALEGFELTEDPFMAHWTQRELGVMDIEMGMVDDASKRLRAALAFFASVGDLSGTLLLLRDVARLRAVQGDEDGGLRLMGAATAHEEEAGLVLEQFELESLATEIPDTDHARRLVGEGSGWSVEEAVRFALGSSAEEGGTPGGRAGR